MLPDFGVTEETIIHVLQWLRLFIETTGAAIVGAGVIQVIFQLAMAAIKRREASYNAIRLTLARYLALALEFQLGADILSTAIAPSWDQIGKLGAIAIIRTALNYFLSREMAEERKAEENEKTVRSDKAG
ncbi:DUF1622 domain-containing protein [Thermithiobacillus plumbiphilus]|uniref:DUF1622 domain-containing protein n=1 Tax=Thermithiobacillus plumbiphilus TaxID=1729899 RepID=A0ABU9D6L1_9PROT